MWPQPGNTIINTASVVGDAPEPLAARLRVSRALNGARFQPSALPPAAILCVRRMRDPQPGALRLRRTDVAPPATWQRALTAALDLHARQAARPALSPAPSDAQAVVFANPAELLACLAQDWCDGVVTARWWWRILLGERLRHTASLAALVVGVWRDAPEYAPAALSQLAAQSRAVRFARRLDPGDAQALALQVARTFGLSEMHAALNVASLALEIELGEASMRVRRSERYQSANPPWGPWMRDVSSAGLTVCQAAFLGIGLMLHRAPAVVRQTGFADACAAWIEQWRVACTTSEGAPHQLASRPDTQTIRRQHEPVADGTLVVHDALAEWPAATPGAPDQPTRSAETLNARREVARAPTSQPALSPHTSRDSSLQQSSDADADAVIVALAGEEVHAPLPVQTLATPVVSQTVNQTTQALPEGETIQTRFGGLFYLINLGLFFGLYADFTAPLTPGIVPKLNIYDFVALAGARLLGPLIQPDPVWLFLARLAGRPDDDASWFVEWVLRTPWPNASASDESREFMALDAIIEDLLPALRERTEWALGLVGADLAQLARTLLTHAARARATEMHLDLFLSLDALPIEIRFSGLDRNPGWVPAAGRFIAFHFD